MTTENVYKLNKEGCPKNAGTPLYIYNELLLYLHQTNYNTFTVFVGVDKVILLIGGNCNLLNPPPPYLVK